MALEPEAKTQARESVQTPSGPVVIRDAIYARWRAAATEMTPDGDDVQVHLGPPLGEQTAIAESHGGGAFQLFARGMIVERRDGRLFIVYGAIYDDYLAAGGTSSALGQPISDEEASPRGGRVAHFEKADIYWHVDFGARRVAGRQRDRYATTGYPFRRSLRSRVKSLCLSVLARLGRLRGRS